MEEKDRMFWGWIKEKAGITAGYLAVAGVFFLMSWLYSLPLQGCLYALLLTLTGLLVYLVLDFLKTRARHRRLREALDQECFYGDGLPEAAGLIEGDYQALVEKLCRQAREGEAAMRKGQKEREEYYAMWAHQIKTPISALRLLLQQEESSGKREMEMELFRVEQYVQMVLSYLRLEDMNGDLLIRTYDLDAVIRQAIKKYSRFFIGKKLQLFYEPVNTRVLTDEKWLGFVLEQLISNAVKYTRPGGSIRIWMDGPQTLAISDTGIGIRREDLPRVFERGFTGFNGREQKRATGLGLYLCSRICSRLSHRIYIDSEPGKGTTVRIGMDMVDLKLYPPGGNGLQGSGRGGIEQEGKDMTGAPSTDPSAESAAEKR